LDRIPASVWERVEEVFVFDDESQDDTFLVGMGYKAFHGKAKLSVFRNAKNLGYGGNQIRGYTYAIEQGYDIVALLHGDGQYAPEVLPELLAPLEAGEADAVFGSRMMTPGAALAGGMPLYKYAGNRILTLIENLLVGRKISEYHTGFRAYRRAVLEALPLASNSDDFVFDNQILCQAIWQGFAIGELSSPCRYFAEASSIRFAAGLRYGLGVLGTAFAFRGASLGLIRSPLFPAERRRR
jgi:glycosyltransferase involved in cell wall biosynthesis